MDRLLNTDDHLGEVPGGLDTYLSITLLVQAISNAIGIYQIGTYIPIAISRLSLFL